MDVDFLRFWVWRRWRWILVIGALLSLTGYICWHVGHAAGVEEGREYQHELELLAQLLDEPSAAPDHVPMTVSRSLVEGSDPTFVVLDDNPNVYRVSWRMEVTNVTDAMVTADLHVRLLDEHEFEVATDHLWGEQLQPREKRMLGGSVLMLPAEARRIVYVQVQTRPRFGM
ncbi:MAG: hypothetical protein PVJ57_09365 [Phycisphaerae bacterium]|jgi:hypothetical protein